ncbi:MAG: hypothetical protein COV45_08215 [Deltaproteobacteria bacterium CG11_big_fil_rev_8_21_14_0_20_47_16]|nr:MAG: hypothetical protein COV45_08215 [Deltaproteobacteria bacterium CG11_big_fil_rev_8_21_14_0_20_47_16]
MPHFNLRHFMETLHAQKGSDVFVLQVGAMDGVSFDPMYEYIQSYRWNGLLVEPISEHFKSLKETYQNSPHIKIANVAIADHSGTATMHRIATEHVVSKQVPRWGMGASSFYNDRNALAFDDVKSFVTQENVKCVTLPELLATNAVEKIDIFQIDAEGHDYHVMKQLDFTRYQPAVIHLEIVNLPKSEQVACKALLDTHGYLHVKAGYNLLAVSPRLIHD